jgi:hypothetical protein
MTEERPPEPSPSPAYSPPTSTPVPTPEPQISWAPTPSTAAPIKPGSRTTLSLVAGVVLIVLGILGVIAAVAVLTIGRELVNQFDFSGIPGYTGNDPNGFVGSVLAFLGIVVLVFSTFYIVGGVGITRSKDWGRITGIVIGILASLFWLLGVVGGRRADISFELELLALHVYVAIALLFFWRTHARA